MENKQTAVEWLVKIYLQTNKIDSFDIEQAKSMEKEQIIEAWNDGNLLGRNGHVLLPYDNGNGYYNEQINYITN